MTSKLPQARGFTLIEMSVVILLMGIIAAFVVPAYLKLNKSLALKGAVNNVAGQIQLARAKAMATGVAQTMHFNETGYDSDYHIHNAGQPVGGAWKLPKNVSYLWVTGTLAGSPHQVTMGPDGRASQSGKIILQNTGGLRDTVDVQLSGLVLQQ